MKPRKSPQNLIAEAKTYVLRTFDNEELWITESQFDQIMATANSDTKGFFLQEYGRYLHVSAVKSIGRASEYNKERSMAAEMLEGKGMDVESLRQMREAFVKSVGKPMEQWRPDTKKIYDSITRSIEKAEKEGKENGNPPVSQVPTTDGAADHPEIQDS